MTLPAYELETAANPSQITLWLGLAAVSISKAGRVMAMMLVAGQR